ncbi:DNA-binding protein [Delftia deserti]|uniref:DNA-binding protein n=2 Tax=Delftia TaxID=80865 RepID=A0ABW5EVT5_9BURK
MRSALPTAEAARHLNRSPGTLNWWSCTGKGPIKPLRVNGRLAWPVPEIKRLMGVEG